MYSVTDVIKDQLARALINLHTSMPGRVESYDRASQTATVQPSLRILASLPGRLKELVQLPRLRDIPVCQPKGYHANLEAGDHVLLIFCERSIDKWRSSRGSQPVDPGDHRAHSVTGAIALPLITRNSESLSALAGSNAVTIGSDGGSPEFVALANLVKTELDAIKTYVDAHTHNAPQAPAGTLPTTPPLSPMPTPGTPAASDVKAT